MNALATILLTGSFLAIAGSILSIACSFRAASLRCRYPNAALQFDRASTIFVAIAGSGFLAVAIALVIWPLFGDTP